MKTVEIIIILLLLVYSLTLIIPWRKRPVWLVTIPLFLFIANLIQLLFYGFRWQLSLVYLLSLFLFILSLNRLLSIIRKNKPSLSDRKWMRITGMIVTLVICYFSFKAINAFPQFTFPEPTGDYTVGTKYFLFEDPERKSVFTDHQSAYYRITTQVWYPAEKEEGATFYYQTKESSAAISSIFGMPAFVLNYLSKIKTNSFPGARPLKADRAYPVIFYSPGGSGWINQASSVNEELASHGFVVISVGHEATEPFLRNENGEVTILDMYNDYARAVNNELYSDEVENIKGRIINCENTEDKYILHQELNGAQPLNVRDVKGRAINIYFVIDKLDEINKELEGIADTSSIGIFGFSKGGAVAGEVCVNDNPFKAGINLDGFMYGDIVDKPITRPFMFVHSVSSDPDAYINDYFCQKSKNDGYLLKINGTSHANFGDLSLFGGIFKDRGVLGPIDGRRAIEIQRSYILAFFEKYLKGSDINLAGTEFQRYKEVELLIK